MIYMQQQEFQLQGKPTPDDDLDPEIRPLVDALNTLDEVQTFDSCWGHTLEESPSQTNQHFAFVGLVATDELSFYKFFSFLLSKTSGGMGKVYLDDDFSGFCISLVKLEYPNLEESGDIRVEFWRRLEISPFSKKRDEEKAAGCQFIIDSINEYQNQRKVL